MRGTLHLVAAEDYGWLAPLVIEPRVRNAYRRLRQEGISHDIATRAVRHIERMLGREGSLTRPEIAERLRRRGIRTEGQAIAHLVWLAAAQGVVCYGPDGDGEPGLVLVREWIDRSTPLDRQAALAELATRYLAAHGPAEPEDLSAWSGIRLGDAKRAWGSIRARLAEVQTTVGPRWTIRSRRSEAPRGLVRLLPSFDEYLLGWRDRGFAVTQKDLKRINRGGGWLHPVVVGDGRAVAIWKPHRGTEGLTVSVEPFSRLPHAVTREVTQEVEDVGRFLRTRTEVTIDRPG
jgi:hypothetical protein